MAASDAQQRHIEKIIHEIVYRLKAGDVLKENKLSNGTIQYDYDGYSFALESEEEQSFF